MLTWPAAGVATVVLAVLALAVMRWRRRPAESSPAEAGHAPRPALGEARDAFVRECRTVGRDWPSDDLAWVVFSRMTAHLLSRVPAYSVTVMVRWDDGGHVLIARPAEVRDAAVADAARRAPALRHMAVTGVVLQQLVGGGTCTEVLLPLRAGGPAWGVLLLRRAGRDGFTAGEIALADALLGLAQAHVEQVSTAARARRAAELDPTTEVPNRLVVDQWLARCFAGAGPGHGADPVSVVLVDVDGLGALNARHGQAAGDHCLRGVARTLREVAGVDALVGRYEDDTFIVLLPGVAAAMAREAGERMRIAVDFLNPQWGKVSLRATISVGLATHRDGERTPQPTLERAHAALRAAKRAGRNCVQVAPAAFS